MSQQPSRAEERLWWAILVDADMFSEKYNVDGDGENSVRAMHVANRARVVLRDTFGVNLDTVCDKARQEYFRIFEEIRAKDAAEKARMNAAEALLKG